MPVLLLLAPALINGLTVLDTPTASGHQYSAEGASKLVLEKSSSR